MLEGENLAQKGWVFLGDVFVPAQSNDYKPRFLESRVLLFVVALLVVARVIALGVLVPFPQNIFFADITKVDLLNLLNQTRQEAGLNTLADNATLDQAAKLKAQDMVAKDYFAHQSPEGITPWFWFSQAGYKYKYAGENLAVGYFDSDEVFNAWFNSPSHKANLLNPNYKDVGTAILTGFGNNNAMVVVQVFGSLAKTVVATAPKPAPAPALTPVTPPGQIPIRPPLTPPTNPVPTPTPAPIVTPKPVPVPTPAPADNVLVNVSNQGGAATVSPTPPRVLGESTYISQLDAFGIDPWRNAYYAVLNFLVYEYQVLIAYSSYVVFFAIAAALLANILINFNIQRELLIIKSLALLVIVFGVIFLNPETVSHITPHQITI